MFKDCKCGRSIPKEWPRCGECAEVRSVVEFKQNIEGETYRKRIRVRSAIAKLRGEATVRDDSPEAEVVKTSQEGIRRTIQRLRVKDQRSLRRQFQHDNLAGRLREWYEDD